MRPAAAASRPRSLPGARSWPCAVSFHLRSISKESHPHSASSLHVLGKVRVGPDAARVCPVGAGHSHAGLRVCSVGVLLSSRGGATQRGCRWNCTAGSGASPAGGGGMLVKRLGGALASGSVTWARCGGRRAEGPVRALARPARAPLCPAPAGAWASAGRWRGRECLAGPWDTFCLSAAGVGLHRAVCSGRVGAWKSSAWCSVELCKFFVSRCH